MHENRISYLIRGSAFKGHTAMGPGLLESVYEKALAYELNKAGLNVHTQVTLPVRYEEITIKSGLRLDIIVENKVIVEIKSVEKLMDVHHKQLLTYLKLSNCKLGLLINFNVSHLRKGIVRIVNGL